MKTAILSPKWDRHSCLSSVLLCEPLRSQRLCVRFFLFLEAMTCVAE
jgi:hypothetical protein